MEYTRILKKSRFYKYGEGEEFKTKDEALEYAKKDMEKAKSKLSRERLWQCLKMICIEDKEKALQVIAILEIPSVF